MNSTRSYSLIAISLQPDVVDIRYFKYELSKIKKSKFEISKVNKIRLQKYKDKYI